LEFARGLVGKCGIYCGACRLYARKTAKAALEKSTNAHTKCVGMLGISCGECQEFPCEKHYGPLASARKTLSRLEKARSKEE